METERWQPPTDDERRLFMEAARHYSSPGFSECVPFCGESDFVRFGAESLDRIAAIAESLALDGADYDAMPDFEELER